MPHVFQLSFGIDKEQQPHICIELPPPKEIISNPVCCRVMAAGIPSENSFR
jgi:hypothetical protein